MHVGLQNIHRIQASAEIPESILARTFVPTDMSGEVSHVLNLRDAPTSAPWPQTFVLGDGSLNRPMLYVDLSPGSQLDSMITTLIEQIPADRRADATTLAAYINDSFRTSILPSFFKKRSEDIQPFKPDNLETLIESLPLRVTYGPAKIPNYEFSTRPLEHYLEGVDTACIHESLIVSILLQRLQIAHQFRVGAVQKSGGDIMAHAWIELTDGSVLDIGQNFFGTIDRPTTSAEGYRAGGINYIPYVSYPFLQILR